MKRYPILLIAWLAVPVAGLSPGTAQAQVSAAATLTAMLEKYCIPKNPEVCADPALRGTYKDNKCVCSCHGMVYDTTARQCLEKDTSCPTGFAIADAGVCPMGTIKAVAQEVAANTGSCPAGYRLENVAKARVCGNEAPPLCDVGYVRI